MSKNSCGVRRVFRLFTVPGRAKRRIGQITDCTVRKHNASFTVGGFFNTCFWFTLKIRVSLDGRSMPMHIHDLSFVSYQSINDLLNEGLIIKDIKANWSAPDQQTLCVQLDYSEVPPKFVVRPAFDFDWKPGYQVEDMERSVQKAREVYEESGKRLVILSTVLRQGYLENMYHIFFDIDGGEGWESEELYEN